MNVARRSHAISPLIAASAAKKARTPAIRASDISKRLQEDRRSCHARIIFDQRLLMRQAHRDLVDPGQAPQGLLDGASAKLA